MQENTFRRTCRWLLGLLVFVSLVQAGAFGCQEDQTAISIGSCPKGEIVSLEVAVISQQDALTGMCPDYATKATAVFTLSQPCDAPTQFDLPRLEEGQQLLFSFKRGGTRATFCETCREGTNSSKQNQCTLQGPPPCAGQEDCSNQLDDDCDGLVNNGCPTEPLTEPPTERSDEPLSEPPTDANRETTHENVSDRATEPPGEVTREPTLRDAGPDEPVRELPGESVKELVGDGVPDGGEPLPEKEKAPEVGQEGSGSVTDAIHPGCQSDADCSSPQKCINSKCATASQLCTTDSNCTVPTERCLRGGCYQRSALCVSQADCPTGQNCTSGSCVSCTGGVCQHTPCDSTKPASCGTGFACLGGFCLRDCTSNASVCNSVPGMICSPHAALGVSLCFLSCGLPDQCPRGLNCKAAGATPFFKVCQP